MQLVGPKSGETSCGRKNLQLQGSLQREAVLKLNPFKLIKREREQGKKEVQKIINMEWRKYYLDVMLVPLGFLIIIGYHVWLWHKVRTQPSSTIIGINTHGRRSWVPAIMKVINYSL